MALLRMPLVAAGTRSANRDGMKVSQMGDSNDLRDLVEELQREIDRKEETEYSGRMLEEYRDPQNVGRMHNPDAYGIVTGSCGDVMEIFLRFRGIVITEVCFMTNGCGATLACGSAITRMAYGRTASEAALISAQDLLTELEGLPEENRHCATLAVDTLHAALADLK